MKSKVFFLVVLGSLFVFPMGCNVGSLTGSGSTHQTIVGTWNRSSFTGDGMNLPEQLIFNENGSGSYSGAVSGAANFTWTYQGTLISIIPQGGADIFLTGPQVGTVTSPLTLTTSTGGTATYNR
jgi:hypothetical protein